MALRSALEDFESTSLGAIPGLLGKLHYLANLHDGEGNYAHWGMGRVHGEETARRAMRTAHATVLNEILRTPLRALAEDLRRCALGTQVPALEFLTSLQDLAARAMPDRSAAASEKHFMAVLHALAALAKSPALASPPDASPPLPPVQ